MVMKIENFSDKLLHAIDAKKSFVVVGLDPHLGKIPLLFRDPLFKSNDLNLELAAKVITNFNKCIIDIVAPYIIAVKPQIAYYEMYGVQGVKSFDETAKYAKSKGLLVIEDAKRNDIGSTVEAYSAGHLGRVKLDETTVAKAFDVDAITINPYLGSDSINPFIIDAEKYGKGLFVLVKTSNSSSAEIQDLIIKHNDKKIFEHVAELVDIWGRKLIGQRGYSSVGAVVGATFPNEAQILRRAMPKTIFLVPGYGAQGATARDILPTFNEHDGYGAIINASRSINYPHAENLNISLNSYESLVKKSVDDMNNDINAILADKGIIPW